MNGSGPEREAPEFHIRRILVALDASTRSLAALEAAAALAAGLEAELSGLFVEDVELLRLAAAPAASHLLFPSATEQALDRLRMESELRAQAERARRELARAAERAHVRWSFRTVRGEVATEVLLAAAEADLLTLGRAGWSLARALRLGSTARAAVAGVQTSLLLAHRRILPNLPVLAVYDPAPSARDACRLAARLAKATSNQLIVFVPSPEPRVDPQIAAEIARDVETEGLQLRFLPVDSRDISKFVRAVQEGRAGLVVIGGRNPLLEENAIERLVCETDSALLIVGPRLGAAVAAPSGPCEE
jgi:nucleotide-binding universal stress UspA family protein